MIVIVEGVDGSGKSTLCKQLSDRKYDQAVINGGNTEFERYKNLKSSYKNDVVILDRSFITDLVYRSIDKKSRRGMDLYEICNICKSDVKIIYCNSGSEFEDSMTRGENIVTTSELSNKIKNCYDIIESEFKTNIF